VHFGKPCVTGTRIPVIDVVELVKEGKTSRQIVRDYYPDLTVEDVLACIRYANNAKKVAKCGDLKEWAHGFSLLSNPTRLAILAQLADGPRKLTSLCKALGMKEPTIRHHLGLLRMGRLVVGTRVGKTVIYEADKEFMKQLVAGLARLKPAK